MATPNPRNCHTCHFRSDTGEVFCMAPLPKFIDGSNGKRKVINPDDKCDMFKPIKGTYARICLNCGEPIRAHHKYTEIGDKKWIHKYCAHPESPSKWHYETYHKN